jgi:hypothetical protein
MGETVLLLPYYRHVYSGPDSDGNRGNNCYRARAPGEPGGGVQERPKMGPPKGPQRGPRLAPEEPRKWHGKGSRREEEVAWKGPIQSQGCPGRGTEGQEKVQLVL